MKVRKYKNNPVSQGDTISPKLFTTLSEYAFKGLYREDMKYRKFDSYKYLELAGYINLT